MTVSRSAEMSCELKLDFSEPSQFDDPNQIIDAYNRREAERNNNNLHIWELGELLELMPGIKVLAPSEIVTANKGRTATDKPAQASIIAALNGPMAHLYVKGANGWNGEPDIELLTKVVDLLQVTLAEGDGPIPSLSSSIDAILVRTSRNSGYTIAYRRQDSPAYVKDAIRIPGMNHPDRSGDIVLIMKDSTTGSAIDRFTTGVACKSWHGSMNPSDSYVPLIVAYPGGNKHELMPQVDQTQGCSVLEGCDGNWKAADLIQQLMNTQYAQ